MQQHVEAFIEPDDAKEQQAQRGSGGGYQDPFGLGVFMTGGGEHGYGGREVRRQPGGHDADGRGQVAGLDGLGG